MGLGDGTLRAQGWALQATAGKRSSQGTMRSDAVGCDRHSAVLLLPLDVVESQRGVPWQLFIQVRVSRVRLQTAQRVASRGLWVTMGHYCSQVTHHHGLARQGRMGALVRHCLKVSSVLFVRVHRFEESSRRCFDDTMLCFQYS
jgi:hypothetical protein